MHRRISTTLNTLRQELAAGLAGDFILRACRLCDHTRSDSCLLTPVAIIHWFLVQILHGNTALTHVSMLAGHAFTASAFCQARAALPLAVYFAVLREIVKGLVPATEATGHWLGHRVFLERKGHAPRSGKDTHRAPAFSRRAKTCIALTHL
jgi:hypothetical protein